MCINCWEEYGSPTIDTPAVRLAADAIGEVYEHNDVGGNLHVLIDDWNIDGDLAEHEKLIEENFHRGDIKQLEAERRCLSLLKVLSVDERASALALYNGFWGVNPKSY